MFCGFGPKDPHPLSRAATGGRPHKRQPSQCLGAPFRVPLGSPGCEPGVTVAQSFPHPQSRSATGGRPYKRRPSRPPHGIPDSAFPPFSKGGPLENPPPTPPLPSLERLEGRPHPTHGIPDSAFPPFSKGGPRGDFCLGCLPPLPELERPGGPRGDFCLGCLPPLPDLERPGGPRGGFAFLLLALLVFLMAPLFPASAQVPHDGTVVRPAAATGTTIIPDRFLRRWDPVTVFFTEDLGPVGGGAEDAPERFVTVEPGHPGAFTWIDRRTLQFRPAEPWPPLARFRWRAGGRTSTLVTLMAPPIDSVPEDGAEALGPVDRIRLTFPEPLDAAALERMATVELRALPGVGEGAAASPDRRTLTGEDFAIKALERSSRSAPASYLLTLRHPIPLGTRALVKLRLSLDDGAAASFAEVGFSTAEPFRATALGCTDRRYPVTPEGSHYSREQILACGGGQRILAVEFSAQPGVVGPVEGRNLVRFEPPVEGLEFELQGRLLYISGDFAWETPYRVSLVPSPLKDDNGRPLDLRQASDLHLYFPRLPAYLRWGASQGVVERYGPQRVPVEGRGQERLDLRLFPVAPFDRSFWPFPGQPVVVDEGERPPGPGEAPGPYTDAGRPQYPGELARQIHALGSPPISRLVEIPLRREGSAATFGLDLGDPLTALAGKDAPGSYLVGLRNLDRSTSRSWIRVQVTDLSLTTVEEPHRVRFAVTSLATGKPVPGARVTVEGAHYRTGGPFWRVLFEGNTDGQGLVAWQAPGEPSEGSIQVRRIAVQKGDDTLVLDARQPPQSYADGRWEESYETWLQWTQQTLRYRGAEAELLAHIFTERPVYRPEEPVHIKGYVRLRDAGTLSAVTGAGWLVVEGPGDLLWRYPVDLGAAGSFYQKFEEEKRPTGVYTAYFQNARQEGRHGAVTFKLEAYRIPRFEVQLHADERVPLDREFKVGLTATYYAGGRVAGRPIAWRVTQFPYDWRPGGPPGFVYSSDGRFSRTARFESSPRLDREDVTDENGGAVLALDPTVEPDAQPRSYVVEATVTGADDQTVTSTRRVLALPPFVLGLKVPRYLEQATVLEPRILALGTDGEPQTGLEVTVRLLHRQWHSHLRASDFSDGVARYITEVVDEPVAERTVTTTTEPLAVPFDLPEAGVYVVEVEARDRLDRTQVVAVDLYAGVDGGGGGGGGVSWSKPMAGVFEVTPDQPDYGPRETAHLVLQSPFQNAEALVVVEAPEGNQYRWVSVRGGSATLDIPLRSTYVPKLPVHCILMRGRVPGVRPQPGNATDLGKPQTVAATTWITVRPEANRVAVALEHPATAQPGKVVEVTVRLTDPGAADGAPLPGEVTLWLVDQAVLALGKEQRLDPLPDFITRVTSFLQVRDTRGLPFGQVPFAEMPGGGEGAGRRQGLLDRVTVRKNFQPVPYYEPGILVGPDGVATVRVQLPDNLTNFKLRAKAASGEERFGFATGHLEVRLPVIVQPALPRFLRPGDRFTAAAIGRVVLGDGGPGRAEVAVEGVTLESSAALPVDFVAGQPQRIEFPVQVPTPEAMAASGDGIPEAVFRVAIERTADGAADAFEVRLPIRPDRDPVVRRTLAELAVGVPFPLPGPEEAARPGTVRRSLLVSDQPALVRMAAGLDFLRRYPYGCTEQKLSRAHAYLALRKFRDLLGQEASAEEGEVDRAVEQTLQWLPTVIDGEGLAAYWPGSQGFVSLTAGVVEFLVAARDAGYAIDGPLLDRLTTTLERALRSDYSRFIDGESWAERSYALAALARAGRFSDAYGAELARRSQFLDLDGVAAVVTSFGLAREAAGQPTAAPPVDTLTAELWEGLIFRLYQGREVYGGLQARHPQRNGLILPSEARTVAEIARAVALTEGSRDGGSKDLQKLVDALVTLGRDDGWGSTSANAAALQALSAVLEPPFAGAGPHRLELRTAAGSTPLTLGPETPVLHQRRESSEAISLLLQPGGADRPVVVRSEVAYVPAADGSQAAAESHGFVVRRELLEILGEDTPPRRRTVEEAGATFQFQVGTVVEEHVQVINPEDRNYVAIVVPLAAGFEPLNPGLATAPPEARPSGALTRQPTYVAFLDDHVAYYYNELPKGTYDVYFRTRATTAGSFVQPSAKAEMMYDGAVRGASPGGRVEIER